MISVGVLEFWSAAETALLFNYSITPLLHAWGTGFPLASAASRQATEPQGPTAQLQKLAAECGIKTKTKEMQGDIECGEAPAFSWSFTFTALP